MFRRVCLFHDTRRYFSRPGILAICMQALRCLSAGKKDSEQVDATYMQAGVHACRQANSKTDRKEKRKKTSSQCPSVLGALQGSAKTLPGSR